MINILVCCFIVNKKHWLCFGLALIIITACCFCSCSVRAGRCVDNYSNDSKSGRPFIVEVETLYDDTDVLVSIHDTHQHKVKHACSESYSVDCGDGMRLMLDDKDFIHCYYPNHGNHLISVSGKLHGIRLIDHNIDAGYDESYFFVNIIQWGDIPWHDLSYFADGCEKLRIVATDSPNLKETESIERMFSDTSFNSDINHWDVSHVRNMSGLFMGNEVFNQPLNKWNTSNVTNMRAMFYFARAFNMPINTWDVSNVMDMSEMFRFAVTFNQSLSSWNVSNVIYMNQMFLGAKSFHQDISSWGFSGIDVCLSDIDQYGENCIEYMFSYSTNEQSHLVEYKWLQDRFKFNSVLCNIDFGNCSLNEM